MHSKGPQPLEKDSQVSSIRAASSRYQLSQLHQTSAWKGTPLVAPQTDYQEMDEFQELVWLVQLWDEEEKRISHNNILLGLAYAAS